MHKSDRLLYKWKYLIFPHEKANNNYLHPPSFRRKMNDNTNALHAFTGKDNAAMREHGNDESTTGATGTDATHTGMKNLSVEDNYTTAP